MNKELIIEITQNKGDSSDDDDLFDNLRKITNNEQNVNKNNDQNTGNGRNDDDSNDSIQINSSRSRKRTRSVEAEVNARNLQKIDENDEDILAFAKKTLNHAHLPDTEDILSALPSRDNGMYVFAQVLFSNNPTK